jgi:hypothetical protein
MNKTYKRNMKRMEVCVHAFIGKVADGSIEFIKLCRGAIEGGIVVMDCG